jgi:hypothetical protein
MTAKETKEKHLYFWRYIAVHPEIKSKSDLPDEMQRELSKYAYRCPLCEYHSNCCSADGRMCVLFYCNAGDGLYARWRYAKTNEERQQAANELVARVEAWEVEEK